jgi:hypothetical protein
LYIAAGRPRFRFELSEPANLDAAPRGCFAIRLAGDKDWRGGDWVTMVNEWR